MASDLAAIALFLVFTCLQTANGQSVKVTRSAGQSDEFTFFDQAGLASCGESRFKSCKDYGATSVETPCDSTGLCSCQTCRCGSDNPTFLSHIRKCAEERNITSMLRKANLTGKSFDKFLTLGSCLQRLPFYTTIVHAFCSWLLSAIWTTSLCPESVNLLQDKPETSKAILAFYFMENICFSIWRRKCLFCNVHCRNNPHISTFNSASWCCLLWCALFIFLFCFAIHSEYLVLPAFYASIPTVQNTWLPQKPELNYLQKGMLSHPPSQPETSHTQPW